MITNILPKDKNSEALQKLLLLSAQSLYLVGENARNFIYGFPVNTPHYRFIADSECVEQLGEIDGMEGFDLDGDVLHVQTDKWSVEVVFEPVADYLLSSLVAGEGVAMHVMTGRLICIPEYLTAKPSSVIRAVRAYGLPEARPLTEHDKKALAEFEQNTQNLAATIPHGQG